MRETANSWIFIIVGAVISPVCFFGLAYGQPYIWFLCPQGLIGMFLRQSQHAYDSLGAAGIPDLTTTLLYYPIVGWLLSRANRAAKLGRTTARILIWHIAAIGLAVALCRIRNWLWGFT